MEILMDNFWIDAQLMEQIRKKKHKKDDQSIIIHGDF